MTCFIRVGLCGIGFAVVAMLPAAIAAEGRIEPPAAQAGGQPPPEGTLLVAEAPLPPEELGQIRGGFALPGGLSVAFGFEIEARLSGAVVQRLTLPLTSLDGPIVVQVTEGGTQRVADAAAGAVVSEVLLNGGATRFLTRLEGGGIASVVQNSRDGQVVQQRSTFQVDVAGMGAWLDATAGRRMVNEALSYRGVGGR